MPVSLPFGRSSLDGQNNSETKIERGKGMTKKIDCILKSASQQTYQAWPYFEEKHIEAERLAWGMVQAGHSFPPVSLCNQKP